MHLSSIFQNSKIHARPVNSSDVNCWTVIDMLCYLYLYSMLLHHEPSSPNL